MRKQSISFLFSNLLFAANLAAQSVGINTTTPLAALDVRSNNSTQPVLRAVTTSGLESFRVESNGTTFITLPFLGNDPPALQISGLPAAIRMGGIALWDVQVLSNGTFQIRDLSFGETPFQISDNAPNNSLFIQSNGNIGIGTSTPSQRLDVSGNAIVSGDAYLLGITEMDLATVLGNATVFGNVLCNQAVRARGGSPGAFGANNNGFSFSGNGGDNDSGMFSSADGQLELYTDAAERLRINSSGNVGIGTASPSQRLHVVGNICATGSIGSCSDRRYKRDFQPIGGALDAVLQLKGQRYRWQTEAFPEMNFPESPQIGFVAQELELLFPELVMTGADGYKSVDYARLTPVLVEAMKEQQSEIETLKAEMAELKRLAEALLAKEGN